MKEDRYERRKTSEKERTPLTFLLGGCFDGREAKKTKNGGEGEHTLQRVRHSNERREGAGYNAQYSRAKKGLILHIGLKLAQNRK